MPGRGKKPSSGLTPHNGAAVREGHIQNPRAHDPGVVGEAQEGAALAQAGRSGGPSPSGPSPSGPAPATANPTQLNGAAVFAPSSQGQGQAPAPAPSMAPASAPNLVLAALYQVYPHPDIARLIERTR